MRPSQGIGVYWDGIWSRHKTRHTMGNDHAFRAAARWLDQPHIVTVEDWGCGCGHFGPFLATHQQYIGVDACGQSQASRIADLRTYTSCADGLHLRGVLEHNEDWRLILDNALRSFRYRAVLSFYRGWGGERLDKRVPVIAFDRADIRRCIPDHVVVTETTVPAKTPQMQQQRGPEVLLLLSTRPT